MDTRGAAIFMPNWYRECKRMARSGGAITLSGLSLLAPVELGIQLGGYVWPDSDRHHPALPQNLDVENAGTAIYYVAVVE